MESKDSHKNGSTMERRTKIIVTGVMSCRWPKRMTLGIIYQHTRYAMTESSTNSGPFLKKIYVMVSM